VIVVPGDIASNGERARAALGALKRSYDEVFVVAGNHDVWLSAHDRAAARRAGEQERGDGDGGEAAASAAAADGDGARAPDSVAKLAQFVRAATQLGVRTTPAIVRLRAPAGRARRRRRDEDDEAGDDDESEHEAVEIVPLLSWYEGQEVGEGTALFCLAMQKPRLLFDIPPALPHSTAPRRSSRVVSTRARAVPTAATLARWSQHHRHAPRHGQNVVAARRPPSSY